MVVEELRAIVRQSLPVFIAQLASMGMMVIDTLLLGHYGAVDLAAMAVAGGIYISVVFALVGIVQSLGPIAAHHLGAKEAGKAVDAFWQGVWLAVMLAVPGVCFLYWPDALLGLSRLEPAVDALTRELLRCLAWGVPLALLYRTFASYTNALGRARVLMVIGLLVTTLHGFLASALVYGWGDVLPHGALGCAISSVVVNAVSLLGAAYYLRRAGGDGAAAVFSRVSGPRWRAFGEFFRLGLPMGLSNFVEITSFTLIALFVAPLGAAVVAGHRIVGNLSAIIYMVPLSIAIATLTRVGRAAGAQDGARCEVAVKVGLILATSVSTLVGVALALAAGFLVPLFSDDPAVTSIALSLVIYVALYQLCDAFQTVAGYALRGLKVTVLPMLIHLVAFWGVGLAGGAWLAYHSGLGVSGFWLAAVFSTVVASAAFAVLLRRALRTRSLAQPAAA